MAQHDYDIANADGATVRADLNSLFEAIASLNSGATAPSTTFAYMWWADTANGLLKRRNAANNAWISVMSLTTGLIIGTDVQAYDADTLFADTSDNLTAGFTTDEDGIGNSGTGTVTPSLTTEALKTLTINGSFTLAPPSSGNGVCSILATNDGTGNYTVTTSGFDYVDGTYNDAANALNLFRITKFASKSFLEIIDLTGL